MNHQTAEIIILRFICYASIPFKAEIHADKIDIDWGDGRPTRYTNAQYYEITHEYITEGLRTIQITGKSITSINISKLSLQEIVVLDLPRLEYLNCAANELYELNLSACPQLEELYCNSNNLQNIHLSGHSNLNLVNLSYNSLTELEIVNCEQLRTVHCTDNRLRKLSFKNCPQLSDIDLCNNNLKEDAINAIFDSLPVRAAKENAFISFAENPGAEIKTP